MLPALPLAWEISDMSELKVLRGRELYDALIALKPANLTETDWAVQAGVNRGFFSNLKSSDIAPRTDTLSRLLHCIGRREADLSGPTEARPVVTSTASDDTVEIQKLDLSLSMGPGTLIDDWVEAEPVKFDLAFLRNITRTPSDRLKLVSGIGDSMYPTLNWGDAIMIDTNERALSRQDGIYWINLYGAAGIKRLRAVAKGRILVKSDNPDIEDQEVDAADLRIEGRAVWVARGL